MSRVAALALLWPSTAARYQTAAIQTQLNLVNLRVRQQSELVRTGAGSQFELESFDLGADRYLKTGETLSQEMLETLEEAAALAAATA